MAMAGKFRSSVAALLACAGMGTAQAIPIVNTGDPVYTGFSDPGTSLFGSYGAFYEQQFLAGQFTTTEEYLITGLSAFVRNYSCCSPIESVFSLSLATGPSNPVDATFTNLFLAETSFTGTGSSQAGWADAVVDNYLLAPGSYWIVASVQPGQFAVGLGMPGGSPNPMNDYAWYGSWRGGWNQMEDNIGGTLIPATFGFRVEGNATAVPEPGTIGLLLTGLLGMLWLDRKRRLAAGTLR
jgi:hypothetical protein